MQFLFLNVFSTIEDGVAEGGERLPNGLDFFAFIIPLLVGEVRPLWAGVRSLSQERVCLKTRAFRGFRPGETREARFPPQGHLT